MGRPKGLLVIGYGTASPKGRPKGLLVIGNRREAKGDEARGERLKDSYILYDRAKKKEHRSSFFYPSLDQEEALSTLDNGENLLFCRTIEAIDMLRSVPILVS